MSIDAEKKYKEAVDSMNETLTGIRKEIRESVPNKDEFNTIVKEQGEFREKMDKMAEEVQTRFNDMSEAMKDINTQEVQSKEYYEERELFGKALMADVLFTNNGKGNFSTVNLEDTKTHAGRLAQSDAFKSFVKEEERRRQMFATVIDTGTSGSAVEWMGTQYLKDVKEQIRVPLSVEGGLLNVTPVSGHNIYQPTKTASMQESGAQHWLNIGIQTVAEKAAPSAHSSLTSGGSSRSLAKALGTTTYSYEAVTDSYLDLAGKISRDLVFSLEQAKEYAYINGATTIADVFSGGNAASQSLINAFDGFLATAINGSSSQNAGGNALVLDDLRSVYAPMGAAGLNPSSCAFLVEAYGMVAMMNLDEVLTVDKYGGNATVVKGEIGRIDGRQIFLTEHLHRGLATSLYDTATPGNNTLGTILYIKKPTWDLYVKDGILVEEDRNITTQVITKAISQRLLLVDNSVGEDAAAYIRNILV